MTYTGTFKRLPGEPTFVACGEKHDVRIRNKWPRCERIEGHLGYHWFKLAGDDLLLWGEDDDDGPNPCR